LPLGSLIWRSSPVEVLAQRANDASISNLIRPVVAVPGVPVDTARLEQSDLAVVAQTRDRQAAEHGKGPDSELRVVHTPSMKSQPA
jgi:hypothetical protein